MSYLLDTHVLIWATTEPELLSREVANKILPLSLPVSFSICSLWEITIKFGLGKLEVISSLENFFKTVAMSDFQEMKIRQDHFVTLSKLPVHHRDPFDRMIVAQAITEGYTLITKDDALSKYSVPIFW